MWALALVAAFILAQPAPAWLPGTPRARTAQTLVAAGEDGRLGVMLQGASLVTWDIDSGRKRLAARLPGRVSKQRWHTLAPAPRTGGEVERALLASERRLALVHLRTGRLIADWPVPASDDVRAHAWAADGRRVGLVGWELPGLVTPQGRAELPVVWVDAETGTVVWQLRLVKVAGMRGAAALEEGGLALGSPRRVIVVGPGRDDARTIAIDHDGVVGATRDGVVVLKKGALVVIDARLRGSARELARLRGPVDFEGDIKMLPGGRWAVGVTRGAVMVADLASLHVTTLAPAALGPSSVVVPSLGGVTVLGRRSLHLDLAAGAPDALLLRSLCARGDCRSGDGVFVDLVSGRHYSGRFRGGEPSGQGVLRYPDGTIYTGPFVRGVPHGPGLVLSPDGDERRVLAVNGELQPAP